MPFWLLRETSNPGRSPAAVERRRPQVQCCHSREASGTNWSCHVNTLYMYVVGLWPILWLACHGSLVLCATPPVPGLWSSHRWPVCWTYWRSSSTIMATPTSDWTGPHQCRRDRYPVLRPWFRGSCLTVEEHCMYRLCLNACIFMKKETCVHVYIVKCWSGDAWLGRVHKHTDDGNRSWSYHSQCPHSPFPSSWWIGSTATPVCSVSFSRRAAGAWVSIWPVPTRWCSTTPTGTQPWTPRPRTAVTASDRPVTSTSIGQCPLET